MILFFIAFGLLSIIAATFNKSAETTSNNDGTAPSKNDGRKKPFERVSQPVNDNIARVLPKYNSQESIKPAPPVDESISTKTPNTVLPKKKISKALGRPKIGSGITVEPGIENGSQQEKNPENITRKANRLGVPRREGPLLIDLTEDMSMIEKIKRVIDVNAIAQIKLEELDPKGLERLVKDLIERTGHFESIQLIAGPSEAGADIIARRKGDQILVALQVKHYKRAQLGVDLIKQLVWAQQSHGADLLVAVSTTPSVSQKLRIQAEKHGIKFILLAALESWLNGETPKCLTEKHLKKTG